MLSNKKHLPFIEYIFVNRVKLVDQVLKELQDLRGHEERLDLKVYRANKGFKEYEEIKDGMEWTVVVAKRVLSAQLDRMASWE
jgi:hypothetical protein